MTIEEKAKAYDKALDRAKNFIENGDEGEKTVAESIFAGLIDNESEDEKIRQFLVDILSHGTWQKEWPFGPHEVVAYLEKQKEPEHFELKEGHWYICHHPCYCRGSAYLF